MKSLFHIKQEYLNLDEELWGSGGEISPELEKRLAINEDELKDKMDAYAYIIDEYESQNARIQAEVARLTERKIENHNHIQRLKDRLRDAVVTFGKVETDTHKFSTRKSTSVRVDDGAELPDEFLTFKPAPAPSPNKTAIKSAILEGRVIPGCGLIEQVGVVIK